MFAQRYQRFAMLFVGGINLSKQPQPALKSYFFEKGYKDVQNTIQDAWKLNWNSIDKYKANISALNFTFEKWKSVFLFVVNGMGMVAVIVFGSALTLAISLVNIAGLVIFMSVIYVGFSLIWSADRVYLLRKKIFTACPVCKEQSLIPTYLCPKCGAKHTNLTPGVYGILKRTCTGETPGAFCGEILPTTFFNGRRHLEGICPKCGNSLMNKEAVPICIPVVGGSSVGKTAFITAFSKDFIDRVAPAKRWKISFYNDQVEKTYHNEITNSYMTGATTKTVVPKDVDQASAISFSFFIEGEEFTPERLVHVYDIAGEFFTGSEDSENEIQQQYDYCHGIVMIIDPFAIPDVLYKYDTKLSPVDNANIGAADIDGIIDTFMNKLRSVTGLSDSKMSRVPIAVLINKIDSAGLWEELGETKVHERMDPQDKDFKNKFDVMDYLCRQFLKDNGMGSFINIINNRFKKNRFFACSAMGHERGAGSFSPKGVMWPMEWLFRNADRDMARSWNDSDFTKKPFAAD
jgi:GTPase SAR1 family protein